MADKLVPVNQREVVDPTVDFTLGNPSIPELEAQAEETARTGGKKEPRIDAIADYVQSQFKAWRDARSSLENKWLEQYRQWRCIADEQDKTRSSERSTIKIPATKEAVTNYVDAMMQTIFAADPFFDLHPNHATNPRPALLRQYMNWLFDKEKFKGKVKTTLTELGIYGTMFGRIRSCVETKQQVVTTRTSREQLNPFTMQPEQIEETNRERLETDYTRPYFEPLSIYNVFAPPTATGVQPGEAEGVVIRSRHTHAGIAALKEKGIIEALPDEDAASPISSDTTDTLRTRLQYSGVTSVTNDAQVEVLEYFGWIPPEVLKDAGKLPNADIDLEAANDESKDPSVYAGREMVVIVAGGKVLNPSSLEPPFGYTERPLVMERFEEVPGEFYGIGIAEIASGPQKALNAVVRSRLDNKAIAINQVFAADRRKLTSGQTLDIYAGKVILTEGNPRDIINQFDMRDVTSGTYQDAAEYERYIRSAHGISELVGGQSKRGEQTATEISSLLGQSMGIIRCMAESYETNVLKPVMRWYARIMQEFPNQKEAFSVIDNQTGAMQVYEIEATDVQGDYDFIPMGLMTLAQRDRVGKTMNFLQMTANPMDAPLINREYLLRQVWKGLGFNDDANVIASPAQAQNQAAAQALPGALAGIVGGEAPGAAPSPTAIGQAGSSQPSEILPMSAPGGTPNG